MSDDFESFVRIYESRGFSGREAIAAAAADVKTKNKNSIELERIKLDQLKPSAIIACESGVDPSMYLS
jgi:hypothetical protein